MPPCNNPSVVCPFSFSAGGTHHRPRLLLPTHFCKFSHSESVCLLFGDFNPRGHLLLSPYYAFPLLLTHKLGAPLTKRKPCHLRRVFLFLDQYCPWAIVYRQGRRLTWWPPRGAHVKEGNPSFVVVCQRRLPGDGDKIVGGNSIWACTGSRGARGHVIP